MGRRLVSETDLQYQLKERSGGGGFGLEEDVTLPDTDGRYDQLAKLIPIDVISAWIAAQAYMIANGYPARIQWGLFGGMLIMSPIYMIHQTRANWIDYKLKEDLYRLFQVIFAPISFIIWAATLGAPFNTLLIYNQVGAGIILIGYLFVITPIAGIVESLWERKLRNREAVSAKAN